VHPLTVARAAVREHGALQKEGELAGLLSLLADLAPQVVVEVGCDAGGTLWAWQQLPSVRRLLGVELPGAGYSSGKPLVDHGAEVVYGDSHEQRTVEVLADLLGGDRVDFLFIDGDHTYQGVKRDFELYSPLVRPDGVIAFHDVCHHPGQPDVGVDILWRQLGGAKEEIVTDPPTWGGIGVLRQPVTVGAGA
jgi:predicted O-methyltransferase YrrM